MRGVLLKGHGPARELGRLLAAGDAPDQVLHLPEVRHEVRLRDRRVEGVHPGGGAVQDARHLLRRDLLARDGRGRELDHEGAQEGRAAARQGQDVEAVDMQQVGAGAAAGAGRDQLQPDHAGALGVPGAVRHAQRRLVAPPPQGGQRVG